MKLRYQFKLSSMNMNVQQHQRGVQVLLFSNITFWTQKLRRRANSLVIECKGAHGAPPASRISTKTAIKLVFIGREDAVAMLR